MIPTLEPHLVAGGNLSGDPPSFSSPRRCDTPFSQCPLNQTMGGYLAGYLAGLTADCCCDCTLYCFLGCFQMMSVSNLTSAKSVSPLRDSPRSSASWWVLTELLHLKGALACSQSRWHSVADGGADVLLLKTTVCGRVLWCWPCGPSASFRLWLRLSLPLQKWQN